MIVPPTSVGCVGTAAVAVVVCSFEPLGSVRLNFLRSSSWPISLQSPEHFTGC